MRFSPKDGCQRVLMLVPPTCTPLAEQAFLLYDVLFVDLPRPCAAFAVPQARQAALLLAVAQAANLCQARSSRVVGAGVSVVRKRPEWHPFKSRDEQAQACLRPHVPLSHKGHASESRKAALPLVGVGPFPLPQGAGLCSRRPPSQTSNSPRWP